MRRLRVYPDGMDATNVKQNALVAGPDATGTGVFLARVFSRIFSRHVLNASLLIFVLLSMSGNLRKPGELLSDPDIWWHLANARILSATHHFIHLEPYSFSVAGERWINPEWLSEMPFWLGYRTLGLAGIYCVTAFGLCANILFVYWRSYRKTEHISAAFWATAIGAVLMTVNSGPRTILFAYLAMSAEMAILESAEPEKARLLWLLPPLFCVWINLHGSWVIGIGLLGLYILCGAFSMKLGVFEQEPFSSAGRKRLIQVFICSAAALLVNPYGWRLIWNPIDMLLNQKLMISVVAESQPLSLSSTIGKVAFAAIGLMVVANCICVRKWKIYELAFLFFAWFTAFNHARFAFLAGVLTIPLLAGDVARSFCAKSSEKTIPAFNALFAAGLVCAFVHFFPANAALQNDMATSYPLQSIASIQPSWRTFNSEGVSGMMDFNSKPTFLDSRYDTFEHHGVLRDYLEIQNFHEPLELLDKYRIDHALLVANSPLSLLLEHTPGWRVERREGADDHAYVLFAKLPSATGEQTRCVAVSSADSL